MTWENQEKGRVLILAPNSPETLGGMEHFVRELARGLGMRGYGVEILHRENSSPAWQTEDSAGTGISSLPVRWATLLADRPRGSWMKKTSLQ